MSVASEAAFEGPVDRDTLVYKHERPLFLILAVLAALFWVALIVGTFGIALVYVLFIMLGYLFAQSALIAWIRGNGVRITAQQFPDLYSRYQHCCRTLQIQEPPEAYIVNGQGVLNAFATKFLGHYFVVLNSNIVDAMMDKSGAVSFYMGHELGHIVRRHLRWSAFLWPAAILPLLGAAYHRAREYTCDAFGRACCTDKQAAVHGLAALAAGEKRWSVLNIPAYLEQVRYTNGFWMSFHELIGDYPWTVKRVARVSNPEGAMPARSGLAWLLAMVVPRFGLAGGGAGGLMVVAIIGIMAAVAIPAYQDYLARSKMSEVIVVGHGATDAVARYFYENQRLPETVDQAGYTASSPMVRSVNIDGKSGVVELTVAFAPIDGKTVLFIPKLNAEKRITWRCASQDIQPKYLPAQCR